MGHYDEAITVIEQRLNNNWTTTPKRFWTSNAPFTVPDGPYVALQVEEFEGHQASFGNGVQMHRYEGIITIQVLTKERTGSKLANQYASQLSDIFRAAQFTGGASGTITCRTPVPKTVGVKDGWFQVNLVIPYKRDKIH